MPPAPPPHRLAQVLLLAGSVTVATALAECGLRAVRPDGYRVWQPGLVAQFQPDPAVLPGIQGTSRFVINREGMRAEEPARGDAYRVLAVGGSTTECLFLDQDEAWPHLLQQRLRASGRGAFVGNVGKSGHTTRQHVLQLVHLLPQHPEVKAVILLAGVNDLQHALQGWAQPAGRFDRDDYAKAFMVLPSERTAPPGASFVTTSRLHALLFAPAPQVSGREKDFVQDTAGQFYVKLRQQRHAQPQVTPLPDLGPALAAFRERLGALAKAAAEGGVRLVLVTQPVLWRRDLPPELDALTWFGWGPAGYYPVEALAEAMDRYNRVTLEVCRERGLECVDLAAKLPRDTSVFYDDCHFNESGARRVAEVLAAHLLGRAPFAR